MAATAKVRSSAEAATDGMGPAPRSSGTEATTRPVRELWIRTRTRGGRLTEA